MKTHRTCDQLGLCQHRTPACTGCAWRLAPGTVEGPFKRKPTWLQRNATRLALLGIGVFLFLFWSALTSFAFCYTGVLNG